MSSLLLLLLMPATSCLLRQTWCRRRHLFLAAALSTQKGFQLPIGSLSAHNMDGAVAAITDHVERELRLNERELVRRRGDTGVRASRQVLLVLDGCTKHVLVGQERVELKDLLNRLFRQLPNLKAAVTMRASSPTDVGGVGISGEKVVVVKGLDDRR